MQFTAIIVLSIAAAVTYGLIHDQITARLCVEYFTIGHPPLFTFETQSPMLLAFGWGIAATWWVGLMLGLPLAFVSRAGKQPKISVRELYRPLGILMLVAGGSAFVFGTIGFVLATKDVISLIEPLRSQVPEVKHHLFIADLWAHTASYVVAFCGGLILIVHTRQKRFLAGQQFHSR